MHSCRLIQKLISRTERMCVTRTFNTSQRERKKRFKGWREHSCWWALPTPLPHIVNIVSADGSARHTAAEGVCGGEPGFRAAEVSWFLASLFITEMFKLYSSSDHTCCYRTWAVMAWNILWFYSFHISTFFLYERLRAAEMFGKDHLGQETSSSWREATFSNVAEKNYMELDVATRANMISWCVRVGS